MNFLNWYGEHPWLGTFLVLIIAAVFIEVPKGIFRRKK